MDIENYKNLISNLPVRQQSFITKRSTWKKSEKEIDWLFDLNNKLFENKDSLNISRQDIFNSNGLTRDLILKTIYLGYPNGMRGNNFVNILKNIQTLETTFKDLKSKSTLKTSDFNELTKTLKGSISGLGLSTYSKLLYFLGIKFNDTPCLILDQRLIDVFASGFYNDYLSFKGINYDNAKNYYIRYLETTNQIATRLQTKGENIEQFLFIFGNNLKIDKPSKIKVSQMWNGYCPESQLKGKKVRMRLNEDDFYESEETRLQICCDRTRIQAIILKFRGEGKFRSTLNYADETEDGLLLSPQNMENYPFNCNDVLLRSDEIENYIKSIKD